MHVIEILETCDCLCTHPPILQFFLLLCDKPFEISLADWNFHIPALIHNSNSPVQNPVCEATGIQAIRV